MILILTALVLSLAACETYDAFLAEFVTVVEEPEETVRFGVYEPLSGEYKEKGELEKIGIELAHELYPTAIKKQVELIYADNQSDMYVAETVIQDLIAKRPAVVLGSYSDVLTLTARKYLEEAKIPAIAITSTNPLVTSNNPYYFRVCFVETYQGVALAKFVVEELQVSNAAIIMKNGDDKATAMSKVFEEKMVQMTDDENAITLRYEYDEGQTDFSTEIINLKHGRIEAVFLPTDIETAASIMNEADAQNYHPVFLGTDEWMDDMFLAKLGKRAEMAAICTVYDPDTKVNDVGETFITAYKAKFGQDAVPEPEVALGFDAYIVAVHALNRIGTALDGELMARSIGLETNFPGASGNITFDANGDPMKTVVIKGVRDGEFVSIYTMEPIFE